MEAHNHPRDMTRVADCPVCWPKAPIRPSRPLHHNHPRSMTAVEGCRACTIVHLEQERHTHLPQAEPFPECPPCVARVMREADATTGVQITMDDGQPPWRSAAMSQIAWKQAAEWAWKVIRDTHANGYGHLNIPQDDPGAACPHPYCTAARAALAIAQGDQR